MKLLEKWNNSGMRFYNSNNLQDEKLIMLIIHSLTQILTTNLF